MYLNKQDMSAIKMYWISKKRNTDFDVYKSHTTKHSQIYIFNF